jgi:hypothetical protein
MKSKHLLSVGISILLSSSALQAQDYFNLSPLTTFGGGDGWAAPGEGGYTYLTTGNTERGLVYGNGHLYLVARGASSVRIIDPVTGPVAGSDLGGLNMSGISGGTYAINAAGIGGDGAIYVGNLTIQSTTSPFKVYKWATEASAPVVAYSGDANLPGSRVGDTLTAIGSGSSTRLAAGFGSSPVVAGNNGYSIIDPTAGSATAVGFVGTPPNAGDFRLGITFVDSSHVIGAQGSSVYDYTSFSGPSGTLLARPTIPDPAGATADRLVGYTVLAGHALLAVQSIGDSHVSVYDATDPGNPVWLASGNNTVSPAVNGNGTGQIAWGNPVYDSLSGRWSASLYALSSNQGIQAFVVTVPEPGSFTLAALGLAALAIWRKGRK